MRSRCRWADADISLVGESYDDVLALYEILEHYLVLDLFNGGASLVREAGFYLEHFVLDYLVDAALVRKYVSQLTYACVKLL